MGKTKSKRIPLHKVYKIKRKINEHHRKARRAARKNPALFQKKLNKDPGIPNSFPFKEEMMADFQERKDKRMEELKEHQKSARQAEQDKRRNIQKEPETQLEDFIVDTRRKHEDFLRREEEFIMNELRKTERTEDSGKDGSMQAYFHEFKKVVESADVILQVLDARDPIGCRCPDVEQTIISKYPNKRIILVLNKIDLVPKDVVEKWIKYLRNELPTIAFKSSTQKKGKVSQAQISVKEADSRALQSSESLGAETLLQLLKHYSKMGSIKTSITVGLIGYPNVGKSSVINSLCRVRAAKVGGTPGVTKSAQEIHLDKHVKLLDTPGIVFPKATENEDDIVLRNVVKLEKVRDPVSPVEKILQRCKKEQLLSIYKIPDYNSSTEFLVQIAKKRGMLAKGGVPVIKNAARAVLQDWTSGVIPFYTEPPKIKKGIHVGASIVTQFAPDFDWEQTETLRSLGDYNKVAEINAVNMGVSKSGAASDEFLSAMNDEEEEEEVEEEVEEDVPEAIEVDEDERDIVLAQKPAVAAAKKSGKQDLSDAADKFNPQTNKNKSKQLKQQKKKQLKQQKKAPETVQEDDDGTDDYSFATHFGLQKQQQQRKQQQDDDEDIDIDDIDA